MSMFSWSSSDSSSSNSTDPMVSTKFWIYWAVTIPLTLFVMFLWRIWWLWQERIYLRELKEASGKVRENEENEMRMDGSFQEASF